MELFFLISLRSFCFRQLANRHWLQYGTVLFVNKKNQKNFRECFAFHGLP